MTDNTNNLLDIPSFLRRKPEADPAAKPTAPLIAMPTGPSPYDARREREAKREARVIREAAARLNRSVLRNERGRVMTALLEGAVTAVQVRHRLELHNPAIHIEPKRISAALQVLVRTGCIVKVSRKRYKVKE